MMESSRAISRCCISPRPSDLLRPLLQAARRHVGRLTGLWLIGLAAVLGAALSGCTSAPPIQSAAPHEYLLGAGDKVQLEVYNDKDMSGQFEVDAGGQISIPLIGGVHVAGLTLRQAERSITDKLKSGQFVNDPNVSLNISQYRPIYVTGEVQKAGQFPFASGMTVLTGVALANGYTPRADPNRVEIIRAPDPNPQAATEATPLEPGDVVKILQRWF